MNKREQSGENNSRRRPGWVLRLPWFGPAVVTLSMLALMTLLIWRLQSHHFIGQQQDLGLSLQSARDGIAEYLQADEDFLLVLADQVATETLIASEFRRLTEGYLSNNPYINAIYYTRPDHSILWATPEAEQSVGGDVLDRLNQHADTFDAAAESQTSIYADTHTGLAGEPCFELYTPVVNRNDKWVGTFVISYQSPALIHHVMDRPTLQGYRAELLNEDGRRVYSSPAAAMEDQRLTGDIELTRPGNGLLLRLTQYESPFWDPETQALMAISFSMICGMGLGLWALNRQISERVRVEQALHTANTDLENRVSERTRALSESNEKLASEMAERQVAQDTARRHMDHLAQIGRVSTMGEMAAGLAHELHQPLAAIKSYGQGCLRFLNDPSPDMARIQQAIAQMNEQSTRAADIIDRLRTFLTPDSFEKAPHDLRPLIEESVGFVEPDRKQCQIDLVVDIDETIPPALVDRVQIQQVLVNLLKNAFESLQGREPSTRRVTITATRISDLEAQVCVHDSGPGCKPEDLTRIFEPFVSTKSHGMGMGLSISRTIIEAHHGRLWAESNQGQGMTFCFTVQTHA